MTGGAVELGGVIVARQTRSRRAATVLAVLGIGMLASGGGYLVGHAGGVDRRAAIVAGTRVGRTAGERAGFDRGYATGLREGERRGVRRTYRLSYQTARREALGP